MLSFPLINISSHDDWSINNYFAKHLWRDSWKARECLIRAFRRDAGLHGACREFISMHTRMWQWPALSAPWVDHTVCSSSVCCQYASSPWMRTTFTTEHKTIRNITITLSLLLRLRAGCPRNRGSISNLDKIFLFSVKGPCRLWGPASLVLHEYLSLLLRHVKQITHIQLLKNVRVSGALPPHMFPWRVQGLYLAFQIIW